MPATVKTLQLHLSTDVEIKLEQVDAITRQHAFKLRRLAQEIGQLVGRTKPHHPFDARAVVPGSVKQNDATGGRQMRHVALKIPLSSLDLGRLAKRHRLGTTRIEMRHEALDGRPLAGSVAAFEQHEQALAALL